MIQIRPASKPPSFWKSGVFLFSTPNLEPSLSEQISDALLDIYNDVLEVFGLSEYVVSKSERHLSGVGKSKGKSKNFK